MNKLVLIAFFTLFSNAATASLEEFYATFGIRLHSYDHNDIANSYYFDTSYASSYVVDTISISNQYTFGLGYLFPNNIKLFSSIDVMSVSLNYTENWVYSSYIETEDIMYSSFRFGGGYEFDITNNFYIDTSLDYSLNGNNISDYGDILNVDTPNTAGISITLGYRVGTEIGPLGVRAGFSAGHDILNSNSHGTAVKNLEFEYPGIIGVAVFMIAGAAASDRGAGGYKSGVAWDQFYNEYYQLVWRCRDKKSGEFVDNSYCLYEPKTDHTWPGY